MQQYFYNLRPINRLPIRGLVMLMIALVTFGCGKEETPSPKELKVGMKVEDLLDLKGSPQGKATFGSKAVYRYPDVVVNLVEEEVTEILWRDLALEAMDPTLRILLESDQEFWGRYGPDSTFLKPEVGMSVKELLEGRGLPQSEASIGSKAVYRYPDAVINLENDQVTEILWRDPIAESQAAYRRAIEKANKEREASRAAQVASYRQRSTSGSRSREYSTSYPTNSGYNKEVSRQRRIVYLTNRIEREREVLDRYSKQSTFNPQGYLISDERADLASKTIQSLEQELLKIRQER